jgi:serine/threonine-protein kinase
VTEAAPSRIGKYEIVQTLGAGAMGVVYLAYDPTIDRRVAVKTIRKDRLDAGTAAQATARFRQEAMAAGRLTHPGIVAVYDYGEDDSTAFIVMEYAPGEDLGRYAARSRLSLPEVGIVMAQLLDALGYAHAAGVVHRDIKPSNMLVSGGRLKITDFGIARVGQSRLTQTGAAMGTPTYMAPEQYRGRGVDHRVDLFAAGVIFYELLTGERPFEGETIEEIAYKVCHAAHVPAKHLRPDLPATVDVVLERALAKDKEARFASAADLSQAIALGLRGDPSAARQAFESAATMSASTTSAAATSAAAPPTHVTPDASARVTQALAKYVGPIAAVMVKKAGADAKTYRDLCLRLSARLSSDDERARFLKDVGVA